MMAGALQQKGFTLLEIMIAVAIFAIASAALIRSAAQTVKQTNIIQERTLGYWIAENELNQIRSTQRNDSTFPSPGSDRIDLTMANRDWEVVIDYEATENPDMRRVVVIDNRIVELVGFVGKY